jgi:hypothetical protein
MVGEKQDSSDVAQPAASDAMSQTNRGNGSTAMNTSQINVDTASKPVGVNTSSVATTNTAPVSAVASQTDNQPVVVDPPAQEVPAGKQGYGTHQVMSKAVWSCLTSANSELYFFITLALGLLQR